MKNRMGVPQEYEPVLPGKVKAHIEKQQARAAEDSLLTQTAKAVASVMGQLRYAEDTSSFIRILVDKKFNVNELTTEELREIKCACVNHLTELIPGIEKETLD